MFIFMLFRANEIENILILKENIVFADSLLDTTIQDGSMRERSNIYCDNH